MAKANILIAENADQVALELIKIVKCCLEKVEGNNKPVIGVSGGSLPKFLVEGIQSDLGKGIDWSKVTFIFCDERMVDTSHPDSTMGLYKRLLAESPIKVDDQFIEVAVNLDVESAAVDYEDKLKSMMGTDQPRIDLLLLGMGPDGHTCSLFPGHELLNEKEKLVAAIKDSPKPPAQRITLTLPVLNNAKAVAFVSTGEGKKEMIKNILKDQNESFPATRVSPKDGELFWIIDKPAASML